MTRKQLPSGKADVKHLLKEAAAAYPRKLLASAPPGHHFSAGDATFLLKTALITGMEPVVATVLAAFPAARWTMAVLDSFLNGAAQKGNLGMFQLLVEAAVAAEGAVANTAAAVTAAAKAGPLLEPIAAGEGSDAAPATAAAARCTGRMSAALQSALLCATKANRVVLVRWVLEQGHACWKPEMVDPSISTAAAAARPAVLRELHSGIGARKEEKC